MVQIAVKKVLMLQLLHPALAMDQEGSSCNDVAEKVSSAASRPRSSSKESMASSTFSKFTSAISSRLLNDSDYDARHTNAGGNTESVSASLMYRLGSSSSASSSSTPQLGIFEVSIFFFA